MVVATKEAVLRRIPLFAGLPASDLRRLVAMARTRWYATRRTVVEKGHSGADLYVILRGRLKVATPGVSGAQAAFTIMGPGEVFGEIALLDGQARSATVTALEPCELLVIERAEFLDFLRSSPDVAVYLLEVLARRVRALSERVEDAAFLPLPARLAKLLVVLADRYGEPLPGGGVRVALRLTQAELGELCGVTRESVNKQLHAWRRRRLVGPASDGLVLLDAATLWALAGGT